MNSSTRHWRTFRDVGVLTALFGFFFRRYVLFGHNFPPLGAREVLTEMWPHTEFALRELMAGRAPLWNPFTWMGTSFIGLGYTGAWYPTTWLYAIVPFPAALKWDIVFHLYAMTLFCYALGRTLFKHRTSAILTALLVSLGAFVLFSTCVAANRDVARGLAYFPLSILCLRMVLMTGKLSWATAFGACLALQLLSGWFEFAMYAQLTLGVFTILTLGAMCIARRISFGETMRRGMLALGAVLLAAGINAFHIVPAYEFLVQESIRSSLIHTPDVLRAEFVPTIKSILGVPEFMNEVPTHPIGMVHGNPFSLNPIAGAVGHGIAFAPLVLLGLIGRRSPERWVFLCCAAAGLFLLYSRDIFPGLGVEEWPLFGHSRSLIRVLYTIAVLVPIVAGYGMDAILGWNDESARSRAFLFVAGLLFTASVLFHFAMYRGALPFVGVLLALSAYAMIRGLKLLPAGAYSLHIWLGVLVMFELEFVSYPRITGVNEPSDDIQYAASETYVDWSESRTDLDRVLLHVPQFVFGPPVLSPQMGLVTGDRMFYGKGALQLRRYVEVAERMAPGLAVQYADDGRVLHHEPERLSSVGWINPANRALLDLFNVRYVISPGDKTAFEPEMQGALADQGFIEFASGGLNFYVNLTAGPPVAIYHAIEVIDDDDALLDRMFEPGFPLRAVALLSAPPEIQPLPARGDESATITRYLPNTVEMEVTLTAPGIVVLSDAYYPGWRAIVDGEREARVVPTFHLLRGIALDEGQHTVRFTYWPSNFTLALTITGISLSILLAACLFVGIRPLFRTSMRDAGTAGRDEAQEIRASTLP